MRERDDNPADHRDDADAMQLLRLSGVRPPAPIDRYLRVRDNVRARWEANTRHRLFRRRLVIGSSVLAAAAALGLFLARVGDRAAPPPSAGELAAVIERVTGSLGGASRTMDGSAPAPLRANEGVRTGEWIDTTADARVALRFADDTSVRLDGGSRLRLLSAASVELTRGAVYIDTGRESGRFEVRTPVAVARDVGTQFEIRLIAQQLRLRVRTGLVQLSAAGRSVSARAGTEVLLSASGTETRPLEPQGATWAWTATVVPEWEIEGVTLSTFLDRFSREHGWVLEYADPALARAADDIVLHGGIRGLPPTDALEVVISTSGLVHELSAGRLIVRPRPPAR